MAVLGRLLMSSAERLDLPDFLSIDSYSAGDFKFFIKSLVRDDNPYVLKGFDIIDPDQSIGSTSVSIRVADSVVFYPGSSAGSFFHGLEEGNVLSQPLIPDLKRNATNYVYLTLSTQNTTSDTRSFWDPDKEGGEGGEFTQDIETESTLVAVINVSNSSFPNNTIPIAKIVMGSNFIESIQDARDMMFRLGTGGQGVDPFNRYNFRSVPDAAYSRLEPSTTMSNSLNPNPFFGGDKNIHSLKEWMDAVMTKFTEIGGTTFWYEDTGSYSLKHLFLDSLGSNIRSKGTWEHSSTTPGFITWSEDIVYQSIHDSREYVIRGGDQTLDDGQVLYVEFERDLPINDTNVTVDFKNNTNYINGQIGAFEHLSAGDWIKKKADTDPHYVRVEQFWSATNGGGILTTADQAQSVILNTVYAGSTETTFGMYCKGVYSSLTDVKKANRFDTPLDDAAGNLFWMAIRSDSKQGLTNIAATQLTIDITESDGKTAKCTSVAHGLSDGERITISGSASYDGTYVIEKETDDIFYIQTAVTTNETGVFGYYALVTTTTVASTPGGIQLESANHNFETDQKVHITDTTNFNGSYDLYVRNDTSFTIPLSSAPVAESTGSATVAKLHVRTAIGKAKIIQGEVRYVGEIDTDNIKQYIGMDNIGQLAPVYRVPTLPSTYNNAIDGQANYNSVDGESLTDRAARLTAMTADKAQDKTIGLLEDFKICVKTTNGLNQDITFINYDEATPANIVTPFLHVSTPSSVGSSVINLSAPALSLAANEVAYFQIDRNNATSISSLAGLVVSSVEDCPLDENIFIFAYRLSTESVWLWNGTELLEGENHSMISISEMINENAYDEILTVVAGPAADDNDISAPISSGETLTIPNDSRDNEVPQFYIVGKAVLELFLNGQPLTLGKDWEEVGTPNTASAQFTILQDLVVGDELRIRIDTFGGYVNVGGPSSAVTGGNNVGAGVGEVFRDVTVSTMNFRTLRAGDNININTIGNEIELSAITPSFKKNVVTKTASYVIEDGVDVVLVDAGATDKTITLPDATTNSGRVIDIKRISSDIGDLLIRGSGTQTIDSEAHPSYTVDKTRLQQQWDSLTVVSNGAAWFII